MKRFLTIAEAIEPTEPSPDERLLIIARVLIQYIVTDPNEWDQHCPFNIKWVGESFIRKVRDFRDYDQDAVNEICVMLYRFSKEFEFSLPPNVSLESLIKDALSTLETIILGANKTTVQSNLVYAAYIMPSRLAHEAVRHPRFDEASKFAKTLTEAKEQVSSWEDGYQNRKNEVAALEGKLDSYRIGFNFVGLYKGFEQLEKQKNAESRGLLGALIFMGCAMLVPLVGALFYALSGAVWPGALQILLPLASIELVLIYFFRVLLFNYNSVNAQRLQIQLRQTLCQFIQSYADYSTEIKEKDSSALEKFENLIFSGLISDPEKLPSTFDGLEQITNVLRQTRNS